MLPDRPNNLGWTDWERLWVDEQVVMMLGDELSAQINIICTIASHWTTIIETFETASHRLDRSPRRVLVFVCTCCMFRSSKSSSSYQRYLNGLNGRAHAIENLLVCLCIVQLTYQSEYLFIDKLRVIHLTICYGGDHHTLADTHRIYQFFHCLCLYLMCMIKLKRWYDRWWIFVNVTSVLLLNKSSKVNTNQTEPRKVRHTQKRIYDKTCKWTKERRKKV